MIGGRIQIACADLQPYLGLAQALNSVEPQVLPVEVENDLRVMV